MNDKQLDALEDHIELVIAHALCTTTETAASVQRSRGYVLEAFAEPKPKPQPPTPAREPGITATLSNWRLVSEGGYFRIRGEIYDDAKGRFHNGTTVSTSALKSIDFEKGIAITCNSVYKLE